MNYVIGIVCINIVIGLIEKFFYPSTFLVILQTILAIIGIIIFYVCFASYFWFFPKLVERGYLPLSAQSIFLLNP